MQLKKQSFSGQTEFNRMDKDTNSTTKQQPTQQNHLHTRKIKDANNQQEGQGTAAQFEIQFDSQADQESTEKTSMQTTNQAYLLSSSEKEAQQKMVKASFSFVSMSPTQVLYSSYDFSKKTMVDQLVLKHIKIQQQKELRTWNGLTVDYIGRPGIQNIVVNKKYSRIVEYFKLEEERQKYFLECMTKYKEIEEEKLQVEQAPGANGNQVINPVAYQKPAELLNFKPPKDMQLLSRDGQTIMTYTRPPGYMDQNQHEMLFKMVKADAKLVRAVFECNGFGQTEGNDWNVCWSSQSYKSNVYESLYDYQRVNHFPNSQELTHKAKLISNVVKMQEKFGKEAFNIIPDSYILPDEFADFYNHFHSLRSKEQPNKWIIKPQNSSQGKGIYIIDDISEVPIDESCIISRYVSNPFLINGLKFDLRIYVGITSMDPWRIYVYNEGLSRFAVDAYDDTNNRNAHLTNFSLNKKNEKFINNLNAEIDDMGHKWSIHGLNKHLEAMGIDMNLMWSRIYDVILKSIICVDHHIQNGLKKLQHKNSCFEILGFDVLMDQDLRPWLMEVNLSPSLATESPLDLKIKSGLFVDMMNLICLKKYDRRKENLNKMKIRVKNAMRARSYQSRQNLPSASSKQHALQGDEKRLKVFANLIEIEDGSTPISMETRNKNIIDKISQLNGKLREVIHQTLIENTRKTNFLRIYPCKESEIYDQYFLQSKPLHKMVQRCLFTDEIIPYPFGYPVEQKSKKITTPKSAEMELSMIQITPQKKSVPEAFERSTKQQQPSNTVKEENRISAPGKSRDESGRKKLQQKSSQSNLNPLDQKQTPKINSTPDFTSGSAVKDKLLITGDDVLIEYVHRLMQAVQSIRDTMMKPQWKIQIEKFVKHYVWHTSDVRRAANNLLWQRLESRLIEMKERRKRLFQSIYLRERGERNQDSNLPLLQEKDKHNMDYQMDFLKEFAAKEAYKNVIIQGFSASQLEEMLRTSTRNVAHEVISCLIDNNGNGVLTEIINLLTTMNKNFTHEEGFSFLEGHNKKTHHYGKYYNIKGQKDGGMHFYKGMKESDEDTESFDNRANSPFFVQNKSSMSVGIGDASKLRKNSIEKSNITNAALITMNAKGDPINNLNQQRLKKERQVTKTSLNKADIVFEPESKTKEMQAGSPIGYKQKIEPSIEQKQIKVPGTAEAQAKRTMVEMSYNVNQNGLFDVSDEFKSQTVKPNYLELIIQKQGAIELFSNREVQVKETDELDNQDDFNKNTKIDVPLDRKTIEIGNRNVYTTANNDKPNVSQRDQQSASTISNTSLANANISEPNSGGIKKSPLKGAIRRNITLSKPVIVQQAQLAATTQLVLPAQKQKNSSGSISELNEQKSVIKLFKK